MYANQKNIKEVRWLQEEMQTRQEILITLQMYEMASLKGVGKKDTAQVTENEWRLSRPKQNICV